MEKKEIEVNEAQVESAINEAVAKMFKGNDIDKEFLDKIVRCELYEIMLGVLTLHNLPKKAFIDCNSVDDADMLITIYYHRFLSTDFYIGKCGTDRDIALNRLLEYLKEHDIVRQYTCGASPILEIDGYYFGEHSMLIKKLAKE